MGRKGLVTSIFSKLVDTSLSSSPIRGGGGHPPSSSSSPPAPWTWPSCGTDPQTASFRDEEPCCTTRRAAMAGPVAPPGEMYKTVNSVYFDSAADDYFALVSVEDVKEEEVVEDDAESCFSTTTASEEWSEAVIRSLGRSTSTHRFFFDPGPPSMNSTLPAARIASPPATIRTATPEREPTINPAAVAHPDPEPEPDPDVVDDDEKQEQQLSLSKEPSSSLADGSVAVAVDSSDPLGDFRASMEEMVAAHGLREWAQLEELLSWYLRVNAKRNHTLIVGAFVDVLIGLASSPPPSTETTTTATTTASTGKSTKSSSSTSATTSTTTRIAARARRGGGAGNEAACCSSSSSSCATPDDSQDAAEEKASTSDPGSTSDDDHVVRHHEREHQCRST